MDKAGVFHQIPGIDDARLAEISARSHPRRTGFHLFPRILSSLCAFLSARARNAIVSPEDKIISQLGEVEAMDLLIDKLGKTKTNRDVLKAMSKGR